MGAATTGETLAAEAAAKANGWTEEQLLNLAGERLGLAVGRFFPRPGSAIGYLGKGHNAGDTLVALRVLRDRFGWKIAARAAFPMGNWAPLTVRKWDELGLRLQLDRAPDWHDREGPLVALDGLLGSGARGPLREPLLKFAAEMEDLRQHAGARVAAVDLPSGIDPETGEVHPGAVTADVTFMIANAKRGLLAAAAAAACGALAVVPVEPLAADGAGDRELIAPQTMDYGKRPRPFDFHKGLAGRVALIAGSENYGGAAVLAATGALRAGAGLVTLFVPRAAKCEIASRCTPEIIVRGYDDPREVLDTRHDALVTGCGLGELVEETGKNLLETIRRSEGPVVIDADALNLIARSGATGILSEKHVLTPHPGEFARLAPDLEELSREDAVRRHVDRVPAVLLLKGCRTLVGAKGQPLRCNSTGTPGMASGGQGDLLSGVIGARLAAGDIPFDAAAFGAWLCGRAAEIALDDPRCSEESLLASDAARFLGAAFRDWRGGTR